ncbi:MAG: diphthamide synthesis protein [Nanoarchaeota archaeon]|nr:diphthamide synthesis protein [Nanoarchaeota archaeon]
MEYDLELNKVVDKIKENNAQTVLVQLGDGIKPKGTEIVKYLESNTEAKVFLWLDSCFGVCDVPKVDVDLIVQFGHNELQPNF